MYQYTIRPSEKERLRYSLSPLPWWLSGKESAGNAGDTGDMGSIPGLGSSPGRGHGNPLQYSCLRNPMDRGARQAMVHGIAELDSTTNLAHTQEAKIPHTSGSKTKT